MTDEFAIKILEQYREKPTLINEIETVEEAVWLDEALAMAIKALEQEPKTGHWIANAPQYDMLNPQYICSECGNAHTRTTPYCEICGAKMIDPKESEG